MKPVIRNIVIHLSQVLDPEAAERVLRELATCAGGERITIPRHSTIDVNQRRVRVHEMRARFMYSVGDLASIFGVSKSTIKKDLQSDPFIDFSEEDK